MANFPRFSAEIWMPFLWAQAKTYYELYGERQEEWNWVPCFHDVYSAEYTNDIKSLLTQNPPDIFAISLYVWNYRLAHDIAQWVKQQWPDCIVVSGGPHQYFKHDINWFRDHPHLDASLPGDCYGEQCFLEMLDNYDNDTRSVDWKKVTDMWYPSRGRMALSNKQSMSKAERRRYRFDWSSMDAQVRHLEDFAEYQKQHFPEAMLLSIIETTRGCPYGCTYCDWGGGTSTTVLQKSMDTVKKDIDAMLKFEPTYIYLADANFGIFGERDVAIMKYITDAKRRDRTTFGLGYGGYAKTANKVEYVRDIMVLDIENNMSMTKEIKLSMQTLDDQILRNIDRKNIPMDMQLEVLSPLAKNNKLPLYVEMIMGLPGMDLAKYYHELDVLGGRRLSVQWFEWILLPETPAYAREYRERFGIRTITKNAGWAEPEAGSEREVVIGSNTFTTDHYLQMLVSNSIYHLLVLGGFYRDSIDWIIHNRGVAHGDLIRHIYEQWFVAQPVMPAVRDRWQRILEDPNVPCTFDVDGEEIYGAYYFVAKCFSSPAFADDLITWIADRYGVPDDIIRDEHELLITRDNFGHSRWQGLVRLDHDKDMPFRRYDAREMIGAYRTYLDAGRTQRGKKKLFGILGVKT